LKNIVKSLTFVIISALLFAITTPETLLFLTTLKITFGTISNFQVIGAFLDHSFCARRG